MEHFSKIAGKTPVLFVQSKSSSSVVAVVVVVVDDDSLFLLLLLLWGSVFGPCFLVQNFAFFSFENHPAEEEKAAIFLK